MKTLEWGVYLIIFCLPLYLVRFRVFNIPTTALELMIYGVFIIWLIKNRWQGIKNVIIKIQKIVLPIILILVGISVATVYSWDLRTSLGIWKAWFIDPLLFFIVLISVIKKPEQIVRVFYSLIFSGFVVSIISLIYFIGGNLDVQGRLQGFYNSPNYLAMYLAPILIASFWILFFRFPRSAQRAEGSTRSRTISKTILLIINCLLLIVVLFFIKSLGAWLGIVAALIFGLSVYLWKKQKKGLIWGIICLGLLVILLFVFLKINSIQGRLSLNSRLIIWQRAWEAFKIYPITGIGPGTFQDYFPSYPRWGVPQPHNLYLAFLLQTGIIGFVGFIWLLIWFFRPEAGQPALSVGGPWAEKTRLLLMMAMVYILVHGLVDTMYWKNDLSVMFWLIMGMMVIIKN